MSDFDKYRDMLLEQTNTNNAWSAAQAQKQMDFQERMSNTAHVREVADLKAAGLNPVLSASGGSGASSPSGASASADQSIVPALADVAMNLANAENAKAIAGMRSASYGGMSYKDPMQNLLLQFLLEATGNAGKSAQEIASDAWNNLKGVGSGIINAIRSGMNTSKLSNQITYRESGESIWKTIGRGIANRAITAKGIAQANARRAKYPSRQRY